jgi:glycosyltransferase involved in cell wall biosynthesis
LFECLSDDRGESKTCSARSGQGVRSTSKLDALDPIKSFFTDWEEEKVTADTPEISVILVFHSRVEYLPKAVDSLFHQTIAPDRFEVVVVGPTPPPTRIDRAASPVTRFVQCEEAGLGAKISAGVESSRGLLVAILEDDDLYEPERLLTVAEAFRADSRLSYFQNGFRIIDSSGRPRPPSDYHARVMRGWLARGTVEIPGSPSARQLRQIQGIPTGFNTSSIVLRRTVVREQLRLLREVGMLVDVTLLYIALVSGGVLRFDPSQLTSIRKHATSDSNPQLDDLSRFLGRMSEYQRRSQRNREYLVEFVQSHGNLALRQAIEGQQAIGQVILDLRSSDKVRTERGHDLIRAVRRWSTFEVKRYWTALPLGLLCMLVPESGSSVYARLRRLREGP